MKLSIIIPVFNEKNTILQVLDVLYKLDLGSMEKDIIIVDDFSTDGTRDLLKNVKDCKIFFHDNNKGKGAAVVEGFKHAEGDIIVIQDADLEYDPNDFSKMIKFILDKKTDVVYGSRFMGKGNFSDYKTLLPHHYMGNKCLSLITSVLFGNKITDMETCYKMFSKNVLYGVEFKSKGFEFEPEITAKIMKRGYKILEIPINYKARDFDEGKKINWKDGIKAFYYLIRYRFFN